MVEKNTRSPVPLVCRPISLDQRLVDADNETIVMTLGQRQVVKQAQSGLVGLPMVVLCSTGPISAPTQWGIVVSTEVPEGHPLSRGTGLVEYLSTLLNADEIQELFDRTTLPDRLDHRILRPPAHSKWRYGPSFLVGEPPEP